MSILARESNAASVFDRHPRSRIVFYLRNRPMAEAVEGSHRRAEDRRHARASHPVCVRRRREGELRFQAASDHDSVSADLQRTEPIVFDDGWLSQAELVIVRSTEGGSVERRLTIADFPIRTDNPQASHPLHPVAPIAPIARSIYVAVTYAVRLRDPYPP